MKLKKLTLLGLMTALCLVLSVLEQQIPAFPFMPPGIKLGLSNVMVMFSLFFLGAGYALTLALCKSLFVFLTRGILAACLSLSGGLLSLLVMWLISLSPASYLLLSVFGAIAHNLGQLLMVSLWLGTSFFSVYVPVLLASGLIMGTLTGLLLKVLLPALKKLPVFKETCS